jgi:lipopolysaccharide export LptBFGC system permease protein LptF
MNLKVKIIITVLVVAGAFAAGRYSLPAKIIEKEHVVYKEKIVEKKVLVKDQNTKKNIVTIRLVTIKPDGTRTIETKTYDKSEIEITQNSTTDIKNDITKVADKEKTTIFNKDSLLISALMKTNFTNPSPSYGIMINKRIFGPFYLGAFGYTDASLGMSLGISF